MERMEHKRYRMDWKGESRGNGEYLEVFSNLYFGLESYTHYTALHNIGIRCKQKLMCAACNYC